MTSLKPDAAMLPQEVTAALDRLRSRIRVYVFWEGLALVIALFGALFWSSFLVDLLYFQWSRLELPRWFRASVLIAGLGLLIFGLVAWVALRLLRSMKAKALALVLERRFPELDDRLITAIEATADPDTAKSPITSYMLQQTIADATHTVGRLDLGSVFDRKPIRRAIIMATVIVLSILALATTNSAAMERWIAGYLNLQDGYWPRETELVVRAIVQPGDRVRDFVKGQYKHAKGTDLTLQVEVPPGRKVPDRVQLDLQMANGRGIRTFLSRVGDEPFRHTIPGLLEDAEFWVTGGDYTSPQPYRVEVVQAPDVQGITLHCLFPEYTGLNERSGTATVRTKQEVNGAQTSLPMATDFILEAISNKPLQYARIEGEAGTERWEITLTAPAVGSTESTAAIVLKSQEGRPEIKIGWPSALTQAVWSSDRQILAIPFILAPDGATRLPQLLIEAAASKGTLAFPLPFPPDTIIRVMLEDADGISSTAPAKFAINGIVDQPPVVDINRRGIGSSITRKARISIAGTIQDDYGLVSARFDYKIDDAQSWLPREFQSPPKDRPHDFILQRSESEPFERFDVLPLDLSVGQHLTLTVSALDGCTVPDVLRDNETTKSGKNTDAASAARSEAPAHRSFSQKKNVFTIVSEEELLSMLYAREINIRKRFEQIISELKQTGRELKHQQEKVREPIKQGPEGDGVNQGLAAAADRSLHSVRKNAVETSGVESSFSDIREELVNNAADTPLMLQRLDDQIIGPLRRINEQDFPGADSALGLFKLALEKNTGPSGPLDEAVTILDQMIQNMEQILAEMRELAKFHEVVEQLKANIKSQQDLLEETKRKRKEKAIKALE